MTGSVREESVAEASVEHRGRLLAVAYRMLGSRADAEDAVQEACLRLARQNVIEIENLASWLTTVVGRVCIDVLRARKTRPEVSYEDRLSELVVTDDNDRTPEDEVLLADSVGLALLVVLDTLRPAERLAFVLHDMFSVPFDEIGQIIGRSTDASRMLASRARRKVQRTHRSTAQRQQQRAVVDAFSRQRGMETSKACCWCSTRRWWRAPIPRMGWSSSWERPRCNDGPAWGSCQGNRAPRSREW